MAEIVHLLLLEDNPDDAALIERTLRKNRPTLKIRRADRADEFSVALQERDWDIIVSDYGLPQMTGLDALKQAREAYPDIPFILVSGYIGEELAVEAMRSGINDFVHKNNLHLLNSVVSRELNERRVKRDRETAAKSLWLIEKGLRGLSGFNPDLLFRFRFEPVRSFQFVSPSCKELLGLSPDDHYADPDLWLKVCHEDDNDTLKALFSLDSSKFNCRLPIRMRRNDGEILHTEIYGKPITGYDGEVAALEGILRDVTAHRNLEEKLHQTQKSEALRHLSADIVTEFDQLLASIRSNSELALRQSELSPELRCQLDSMNKLSTRASALTNRLLSYSSEGSGSVQTVSINETIEVVKRSLQSIIGSSITLTLKLPPEQLFIACEPSLIEQALVNLAINSRDTMPSGGAITISVNRFDRGLDGDDQPANLAEGDHVVLTYSDSETRAGSIINRLSSGGGTMGDVKPVSRQGLSASLALLRQLHGQIVLSSQEGKGTSVRMFFPEVKPQAVAR